jgi:hypothetical protein
LKALKREQDTVWMEAVLIEERVAWPARRPRDGTR